MCQIASKAGNLSRCEAQQAFGGIPDLVAHKVIHSGSGKLHKALQIKALGQEGE
jgi:hypothetical protein